MYNQSTATKRSTKQVKYNNNYSYLKRYRKYTNRDWDRDRAGEIGESIVSAQKHSSHTSRSNGTINAHNNGSDTTTVDASCWALEQSRECVNLSSNNNNNDAMNNGNSKVNWTDERDEKSNLVCITERRDTGSLLTFSMLSDRTVPNSSSHAKQPIHKFKTCHPTRSIPGPIRSCNAYW